MTVDQTRACRDEWLVTAGDGSYAMGSVDLLRRRRYHGLLMRSVDGPSQRRMLVTEASEQISVHGEWIDLGCREWVSGAVSPDGRPLAPTFELDDGIPTWSWRVPHTDGTLVRRVLMEREAPVTRVLWSWSGPVPIAFRVAVLTVERDAHGAMRASGRTPTFSLARGGVNLDWPPCGADPAARLHVRCDGASFTAGTGWWNGQRLAEEATRGYASTEDVFHGADVEFTLPARAHALLALGAVQPTPSHGVEAIARQRQRARALAERAVTLGTNDVRLTLAVAADQFVVTTLPPPGRSTPGVAILAGYPWFAEWGRDTMLSLRGLLLLCGRVDEAAALLRQWAAALRDGALPNRLPDRAGEAVEHNSADAPLLFVRAIRHYSEHTMDSSFVREMLPAVRQVVDGVVAGLPIGVREDPQDGLVEASWAGHQLTWMDAKCGDWVVTPRRGKPVEISALWHDALVAASGWEAAVGDLARARLLAEKAALTRRSFDRFWNEARGHFADVLDGTEGDDWSLRPNQLFALEASPTPLVGDERASRAASTLMDALLAGAGVRTLDAGDSRYRGRYEGPVEQRDAAYHNGTAWPFLLSLLDGALARAPIRSDTGAGRRARIREALRAHLGEAGRGSISEILDGDAPHEPRGCPWQAWSVAAAVEVFSRDTMAST